MDEAAKYHKKAIASFVQAQHSFIHGLLPESAVQLSAEATLDILQKKLGAPTLRKALNPAYTIQSPLHFEPNTDWIKRSNMVGINVRTIDSFWNMVKYAFTLPKAQQSIHILPIWEPGVVASLYGMASWNINPEFFSTELYHLRPQLDTVEKQLKVSINLLHALGKVVGMDVIPHTDRYSEIVLANPQYFEWLRRVDLEILNHEANFHEIAQFHIHQFLLKYGSADGQLRVPNSPNLLFQDHLPEAWKLRLLFGHPKDYQGRNRRRGMLVDYLYRLGLEPVPATMAPPYRGLEVDPDEAAKTIDEWGRIWRDYRITKPEKMSRVFGPLTRYKLYERKVDNQNWEIDFNQPRPNVWAYVKRKYSAVQQQFNFDFMRGDMSHVQMRATGVPANPVPCYDIHQEVKNGIIKAKPYFAYYAESFLAPDDTMAYGNEVEHLVASDAEVTLGDLQSMVPGSDLFLTSFAKYISIAENYSLRPCWTIMTADKDDPRFDQFYVFGNEARLFIGLFLTDFPSYMGLGFECRDVHLKPVPNEHYTKLYVFQISEGPKATHGPYIWGQNKPLFYNLERIKIQAGVILPQIEKAKTNWLIRPSAKNKLIAWTQIQEPKFLFVVNLNFSESSSFPTQLNNKFKEVVFSTHQATKSDSLKAGECRIYKLK